MGLILFEEEYSASFTEGVAWDAWDIKEESSTSLLIMMFLIGLIC